MNTLVVHIHIPCSKIQLHACHCVFVAISYVDRVSESGEGHLGI